MQEHLRPLVSLPFLICLGLLLLNDFYLKAAYPNVLTGKLSDICGLFIFPIVWSALKPKYKSAIFITTAVFFIYWKSIYSQSFIDFFSRTFFAIERTVDMTDLLALPVLAAAWFSFKSDLHTPETSVWQKKLNPYFIAAIAVFSFYSTSQPRYVLQFDQPQYVLLKSDVSADSTNYGNLHYYPFGSLLAVKIDELDISQRPVKNDDYHKNAEIENLDRTVSQMLGDAAQLIPVGTITSLNIKNPEGEDSVRFNGSRLDGKFIRKKDGKVIIEGFYKKGLEDSVWTFRDAGGNIISKVTFVNGERTAIRYFKNNKPIRSENIDTRSDTIRNKGIQIALLVLLFAAAAFLMIRNYRQSPEKLKIRRLWKWLLCLSLPVVVWCFHFGITYILGDYNYDVFIVFGMAILTYLLTCPLFFIVIFWIKPSKQIDILWYGLLFALFFSIWIEVNIFLELSV